VGEGRCKGLEEEKIVTSTRGFANAVLRGKTSDQTGTGSRQAEEFRKGSSQGGRQKKLRRTERSTSCKETTAREVRKLEDYGSKVITRGEENK